MPNTLPTSFQQFIHMSRYAKWMESENRRETWAETVDRYLNYMCDVQCKGKIPAEVRQELREGILTLEVMPSMRCMMTAGPALERDNVAGYNCSGVILDDQKAFDELLYLLMCVAPETLVRTDKGDKPISAITTGDKVLSLDKDGKYEYVCPSFVGETSSSGKKKIELELENGHIIRVTEDHKFLTNRGWVEARDLTVEDDIRNYHEL